MTNPYTPPAELNQPPGEEAATALFKPPQWALAAASYNVFISGLWIFLGLFYLPAAIQIITSQAGTSDTWTSSVMAVSCLTLGGLSTVVTVGMYRLAHWTQTWSIAYCVAVFALPMLVMHVPQLGISVGLGGGICCASCVNMLLMF